MAPCSPALNFVPNGRAGSAFPPPLDPAAVPLDTQQPTFSQVACEALAEACSSPDPISAIDDLSALTDAIDALAGAADTQLATILEELDSVVGQQPINDALDAFDGAQPGATSLLGDVSSLSVPAIGQVPMVLPNGAATITFGGSPATGGVPTAGSAQYVLHLPLVGVNPGIHSLTVNNFTGPNPPFGGAQQTPAQEVVNGQLMYVALVTVNPVTAGTFTGTVYYLVNVTIGGITGTLQRQLPFQVVVEP